MNKKYINEKGVALLFAIGILALLMVLALAFVTNAVLGQKIASNVNNRTQATLLARSAYSRLMASLASYNLQYNSTPEDFSFLHSYDNSVTWQDGESEKAASPIDDLIVTKTVNKKDDDTEEIITLSDSLMDIYANTTRYYGKDSQASWLFYKDTAGKLIGRVAYWILPLYV
jgi:type II secretory pathway pseudopilin PulG